MFSFPSKKLEWDNNKASAFVQSLGLSDVDSALQSLQEEKKYVNIVY